ncbi:MAG: hypothetical protein LBF68_07215 [Christensenellaceae bacterium]|nr:hypothetical protein [Christensenellaceae bacterium]
MILIFLIGTSSCSGESDLDKIKREFTDSGFEVSDTSKIIEAIQLIGLEDIFYLTHSNEPHVYAAILVFDSATTADASYFDNKEIVSKIGKYALYARVKKGGTGQFDIFIDKFKEIVSNYS